MNYPRYNNGHVDDGREYRKRKCPNCNSENYSNTMSLEECKDCGLKCDYWGDGANEVYNNMMERNRLDKEERDFNQSEDDYWGY